MPARNKVDVGLLRKAVRAGTPALVTRVLEKLTAAELARMLAELSPGELRVVLESLVADRRLTTTIQAIPEELLPEVVGMLDPRLLGRVLTVLEADDGRRFVSGLDDDVRQQALYWTDPERAKLIELLLSYEEDCAGALMNPRFVAVRSDSSVGDAIRAVREAAEDVPHFYVYVTENGGELVGVLSLSQLVKAADDTPVSAVMVTDVAWVAPDADQEEVAHRVSRRNLLALPVVDNGVLLGLVTIDDVIDILEEEATEDMYNMAGLSEGDRVFSPPLRSLTKRLPWNALNLCTSLAAASVVALFENTIDQLVALAVFMPVVAGIGGNTGNQTLTVIIRGITLGELEFSSAWRALGKEVLVGLSIGVIMGSTVAVIAFLWKGNPYLGGVIALAMVANLCVAALCGTAIPLTLKRFGMDPALGGSILVTMCTDVFGFLSFLGLATLFMHYLL